MPFYLNAAHDQLHLATMPLQALNQAAPTPAVDAAARASLDAIGLVSTAYTSAHIPKASKRMIQSVPGLSRILLIDDDEAANFIHKYAIRLVAKAEVITNTDSTVALQQLSNPVAADAGRPDLIFVDIHMPKMGGWEFLKQWSTLPEEVRGRPTVVMLTTSMDPDDVDRARAHPAVAGFVRKPLTARKMEELIAQHFSAAQTAERV